ncbi:hypothetical protein [Pseudomonas sp. O39]|uniref:hypothetical protein n=1 Tax=Pseudomonas sp. O39 TaxID=3379130 RepID=UPI00387B5106
MPDRGKIAATARYDLSADLIVVQLLTGAELCFKPAICIDLLGLSPQGLATIQVSEDGAGIEFLNGDVWAYLPELMEGQNAGLSGTHDRLLAITAQIELLIGSDQKHPLWHSLQNLKSCLGSDD